MSTVPTTPANLPTTPRPLQQQSAPFAQATGGSIDPIKLLNKHKWVLVGAGVVGGLVGTGLNYALEEIYPVWKPIALFQCTAPVDNITQSGANTNEVEMSRFMQTQVRLITSDSVLSKVAEDPALQTQAPVWSKRFMRATPSGDNAFNPARALKAMGDKVGARVIPSTSLIEVSFSASTKEDATAILGLVRQKYIALLASQGQVKQDDSTKSLTDTIARLDTELSALQTRRRRIIESDGLESIDERASSNNQRLQRINLDLAQAEQDLRAFTRRRELMKAEIDNPQGFVASDENRERVDRDPLMQDIKVRISRYEDELKTMLNKGMSREHREYLALDARLAGTRANMDEERTRLLRQIFDADLDKYNKEISTLEAQVTAMTASRDELSSRQVALTQLQTEVSDIERQIDAGIKSRMSTNDDRQKLISMSQLKNANRVIVIQEEKFPLELSFPQLKFMIPLGIILGIGMVGGIVFLREIIDQRVKGPSDINLMPRMKLLGWVPDASEDPEGKGAAESAFRDRPKGVLAESYRQLRSSVVKRIDTAGHKSLLVIGGMPGAGASSVTANLALAMAAADRRVLVVDANFRRPAQHRIFGVQEAPGLADVLGSGKSVESVIQRSSTPNVDVLSVGSKEMRVVERLAANAKGELIAKLKGMYDFVIIDVAPAVVANDCFAIAQRVDSTLLVVRAMADKRGMVTRIRNEIGDTRGEFLGVVVNAVRTSSGGYMRGNIKAAADYAKP